MVVTLRLRRRQWLPRALVGGRGGGASGGGKRGDNEEGETIVTLSASVKEEKGQTQEEKGEEGKKDKQEGYREEGCERWTRKSHPHSTTALEKDPFLDCLSYNLRHVLRSKGESFLLPGKLRANLY